jgi:PAS domain S-box-containing protein
MESEINEREIALRKCYTELTEEDVSLLREVQPLITSHLDELVDGFYSHLLAFEETRQILRDESTVKRLKDAQRHYLTSLFSGDYGPEYVENRMRIGEIHHKVGLGIKWYLGAVHRYEWLIIGLIQRHAQLEANKLSRIGKAICSILYFDTQWVLEAYELDYTKELRNTIGELKTLAHQQSIEADLGQRALATTDLPAFMEEVVNLTAKTLEMEYCNLMELLQGCETLLLRAGVGWKEGLVGNATVKAGVDSFAGYVLLRNEPIIVEDYDNERQFSAGPLLESHGVVSSMGVVIYGLERPFGILGVHSTRPRTFTKDDINFLRTVANILAMAIERSRAEGELKRRMEELEIRTRQQAVVAGLGQRVLEIADLHDWMDEAVSLTAQILNVEYCKILELLPDGKALLLRAGVGWKEGMVGRATVGAGKDSQAGYTLLTDEPVIVKDLRTETRFTGPPLLREHGVVSGISVLIRTKERPYGVFGVHTTRLHTFTKEDINFLQSIANLVAVAIGNKQTEIELRKGLEELQIDRQAFESISECIILTDLNRKIVNVNPACLKVTGYAKEELIGKSPKLLASDKTPQYVFSEIGTALTKKGEWFGDIINKRKDGTLWDCRLTIRAFKDLAGIPRGYIGLMADITSEKRHAELLEHHAKDVERLHQQIKNQFEETIYMFAMACEAKDEVTGNHVRRIREYSTAIARELGLTEELAEEIGVSSILHDVGKIHIPDSILRKPGPLRPEEMEIMKTHTLAGEKILSSEFFQVARNIALYHHENYDGTGYPKGLKGAEIPIEARIAKVADVFDALTSKRPYKPAFSEEESLEKIRAMKGKALCPMVLEAFEGAYKKGVISEIRRRLGNGGQGPGARD